MKKNLLYILAVGALLCSSCDSQLDVEPAGSSVSDEQLQELINKDADKVLAPMMQSAISYLHTAAPASGTEDIGYACWGLQMDLQANDMVLSKTTNWYADEYTFLNLRRQTDSFTSGRWGLYYKMVYKANQILDLLPDEVSGNAAIYKAQALTYRSLAYYNLMYLYQDNYMDGGKDKAGVPLHLTVGGALGRETSVKVYAQVKSDLEEAIKLFKENEYDSVATPTDIDQDVANLILARVCVTIGEYTAAVNAADAVIKAGYSLMNEAQYTGGFLDVSLPETIFGYNWSLSTSNGNRAFSAWTSPSILDFNGSNMGIYICIDDQLYNQIPDTDYRKKNFVKEQTQSTKDGVTVTRPAYLSTKYDHANWETDEIFMRLSEAYLLKAEAEARNNQPAAAQQTLYDLVSKRDSGYTKSSKTGAELLKEIHLQSRIELWGEGHEWYTNKRFNVGVDRSKSGNHVEKAVHPAGKFFTFQIPLSSEINSNPYITDADQNPL